MVVTLGLLVVEYFRLLSFRRVMGDFGVVSILPKPFWVVIIMLVFPSKEDWVIAASKGPLISGYLLTGEYFWFVNLDLAGRGFSLYSTVPKFCCVYNIMFWFWSGNWMKPLEFDMTGIVSRFLVLIFVGVMWWKFWVLVFCSRFFNSPVISTCN